MGRRPIHRPPKPVTQPWKSKRLDEALCTAGKHDWIPANIYVRSTGQSTCRPCSTEKARKAGIDRHLTKTYGISADQYDALLASQGGVCAICQKPPGRFKRRLAVDHHHASGAVRGILCVHCNRAIGLLLDRPDLCMAAASYLKARAHCAAPKSGLRRPRAPQQTSTPPLGLPFPNDR
jgi:hypothetical protein